MLQQAPAAVPLPLLSLLALLPLLMLFALVTSPQARADEATPADGVWPLRPRPVVVARFDPPATRWGPGHRGVDLAGRAGQPVRAAAAGRVTFAGRLVGRGVVVVSHGATRTTYEPVSADVGVGDRVRTGEVLGSLQLFGSHCFPRACLHWGLIEGRDRYRDPLTLVGAGPVRLLPLDSLPTSTLGPAGGPRVPAGPTAAAGLGATFRAQPHGFSAPMPRGTAGFVRGISGAP